MYIWKKFDDAVGKVCEAVLPIKHDYYIGSGKELAICTLSSIGLLEEISKSDIMSKVAIAGGYFQRTRALTP